ncbi:phosphatidylglycerol--membrane-oligosaccharide glycerophosphotransferase [Campylobacterota bacterium]|nr:phosphatidylglycerol--membrane-oligosaccharide glycerophosphotransferase [Campylobacterota bacterium]
MHRFNQFFHNIQQELKAFLFYVLLFMIFRAIFIYAYRYQLDENSTKDVLLCIWYGLRLSLKTAGWIVLVSFLFSTLPQIVFTKWRADTIRKIWHSLAVVFLTVCFFTKIPYYEIYNSGFDMMLINGAHDDLGAIVNTVIEEYQAIWRSLLAIIVATVLTVAMCKITNTKTLTLKIKTKTLLFIYWLVAFLGLVVFFIFVRYGGAFNYANSINWESAARLSSNLLNEAILDDGQALYRVRSIYMRTQSAININISEEALREHIETLGGVPQADTIEEAFAKRVLEQKLSAQPNNVIFILGESYALWTFLPEYIQLGLVEKGVKLQNAAQSFSTDVMLARGSGTISAVNGLLTGMHDAGFYENYEPTSYHSKYATGIGAVMKSLGYKTVFWYGGFETWQNIKNFALAQSFDEFHGSNEFNTQDGNSWGSSDKLLFSYVEQYIKRERESNPSGLTFHFILTTSNHPPYTLDVVKAGFDIDRVKNLLPPSIANDEKTLNQLGHIWYADHAMGNFVESVEAIAPETLFVITGDHAERFHFQSSVDTKTLSAVPCIFYGYGIDKNWLPSNKVGTHIQIIPTLAELIGKKDHKYSAILPSLFDSERNQAFNYALWIDNLEIGELGAENSVMDKNANAAKTITIWRVKKGNNITKPTETN